VNQKKFRTGQQQDKELHKGKSTFETIQQHKWKMDEMPRKKIANKKKKSEKTKGRSASSKVLNYPSLYNLEFS